MPAPCIVQVPVSRPGVQRAGEALDSFCARHDLPRAVAWRLRVALDEILANIVDHGRPDGDVIDVGLRFDAGEVEVTVVDAGPAFDPLALPPPDTTAPLEARRPGGLGIALVKALMDDVSYERRDEKNVLVLRKRTFEAE